MRAGRASRTAEFVCAGRAIAHAKGGEPRFEDPTAFVLLPEEGRQHVERALSPRPPAGLRARLVRALALRQSKVMVVRTVAIDDAIRAAASPQVVILGAGLDGRAWRMGELRDAVVFEVDHPASQYDKRARAIALTQTAREIRFVAVDFERDSLDEALTAAGHDPSLPTTWVWEGVVMYLTPADVEATLATIARRSAPRSRLVVLYHAPALILRLLGLFVRRLGEPFRSAFTPEQMRALLAKHRFEVVADQGIPELGAALSPELGAATKRISHLRIVTADSAA